MKNSSNKTLQHIKQELDIFADELCNTHKLSSILNSYCKSRINEDALYEVSYVAELIEKNLSKLGYDLYKIINCDKKHKTIEEVLKDMKRLQKEGKVEFSD